MNETKLLHTEQSHGFNSVGIMGTRPNPNILGISVCDAATSDTVVSAEMSAEKSAKEIMDKVAELLLETAVHPRSRRETKKAMQKIKRLMRKYGDLKIAERNLPTCCGGQAHA